MVRFLLKNRITVNFNMSLEFFSVQVFLHNANNRDALQQQKDQHISEILQSADTDTEKATRRAAGVAETF